MHCSTRPRFDLSRVATPLLSLPSRLLLSLYGPSATLRNRACTFLCVATVHDALGRCLQEFSPSLCCDYRIAAEHARMAFLFSFNVRGREFKGRFFTEALLRPPARVCVGQGVAGRNSRLAALRAGGVSCRAA
eukprot:COSAG02_NODE_1017_length_15184_cov_3.911966_6_plen_133_part_00